MGKRRGAYRGLLSTSEGRRSRGCGSKILEYVDFKETGWEGVDWVDQAHDRDR